MEHKVFLIFGISRGLGKAITREVPQQGDIVFGISRTKPDYLEKNTTVRWISADLSNPEKAIWAIKEVVGTQRIDCLIYNVGIWENDAFTEHYDFTETSPGEISTMIQTNVTSCILAVQAFVENMKKSKKAKIVLIGSTWGVDNHNGKEVAFSATKFALRGIAHSLRENLRADRIGVSVLNLGYLATEYEGEQDLDTIAEKTSGQLIPLQDVIAAINFVLSTSPYSCVKEITMPAMADGNV
jgi:short-subunit dehydrogenase